MHDAKLSDLIGKTLSEVTCLDNEIRFTTSEGKQYLMLHDQDCCEAVNIEDICGELSDLQDSPIVQAEESCSDQDPPGYKREYPPDSITWTFYRLCTMKGSVVIRWLGESNGYYSEGVSFKEVTNP